MNPETQVRVEESVARIVEMFETGNLPAAVAQTVLHRQASDVPSATWSLGNQLLMIIAGTTDARGFNQWKAVGRYVKKGSKATYILAPKTAKVKGTNDKGEETEKVIATGFLTVPVFKFEDTEGEEIARPDYHPPQLPPLFEVAKQFGVKVEYGPFTQRFYGYYRPSTNAIMLCTHDVSVFFHELAHAVHNTFRPLKGGQDQGQEIVAETVAATLCHLYGYSGSVPNSYKYIAGYAKGTNPGKAILKVLADVQKVLTLILETTANADQEAELLAS